MRPGLWLALAIAVLPACEIDFAAVEEVQAGHVRLVSEHGTGVEASLDVGLTGGGSPPVVLLEGNRMQGAAAEGRWVYSAAPVVDTLRPRLELEIRTSDTLVAALPFLTRNGPGIRRQNGDLELPVAYGGEVDDPQLRWRVALLDSVGQPLLTIHSGSAPLPRPIVLSHALVPAGAVTAEVTASRHDRLSEAAYSLTTATESVVLVPIGAL